MFLMIKDRITEVIFPISGGIGTSIDKPVVIERQDPNDYVSIEYGIVRCLCLGRGVEWELVRQTILKHKGRTIDQIKNRQSKPPITK